MAEFRIVIEGNCDGVPGMWHEPEDFLQHFAQDAKRFPSSYRITVKMEHAKIAGKARSRAALAYYNYKRHIKTCRICIGSSGCETARSLRIWSEIFDREANEATEIVARNGG